MGPAESPQRVEYAAERRYLLCPADALRGIGLCFGISSDRAGGKRRDSALSREDFS